MNKQLLWSIKMYRELLKKSVIGGLIAFTGILPLASSGSAAVLPESQVEQVLAQKSCDTDFFWYVTGKANMRSGPGTDYPVIGSVKKGSCLAANRYAIDGRGRKWIRITYLDTGVSGWVSTANLRGGSHPRGDWCFGVPYCATD